MKETDSSSAGGTDSANVDSATDSSSEDVNRAKLAAPTSQMDTQYIYRFFLLRFFVEFLANGCFRVSFRPIVMERNERFGKKKCLKFREYLMNS